MRCTLYCQVRPPISHSVDEVVLGIAPEFLERWADCTDTSRRSETATLRIAGGQNDSVTFWNHERHEIHERIALKCPCHLLCVSCVSWLTHVLHECGKRRCVDEVVLGIGVGFLEQRAGCKDSSRRSETATFW
jgi:hypothetical protein